MSAEEASSSAAWAAGVLPAWARVTTRRASHLARVAALMDRWAAALRLDADERARWRTAAWLHDALRDAPPASIRDDIVDPELRALPASFLHGPAAADRMAADGFLDAEVLDAVRYHTLGHADLGRLGRALIAADYLEPGRAWGPALAGRGAPPPGVCAQARNHRGAGPALAGRGAPPPGVCAQARNHRGAGPAWHAALRARLPFSFDAVVREVIGVKLVHAVQTGHALRPEMTALWNRLAADARAH